MRVAILTNDDPREPRGGAAQIVDAQERCLKSAGFEVRVFCPSFAWLRSSFLIRLGHHLRDFGARRDLVREISVWEPDILISHNLTGCGFATPRRIRKLRVSRSTPARHSFSEGGLPVTIRWFHVLHDVQLFEPSGRLPNARRFTSGQRIWSALRGRALGKPDLIISPTQWLLDQHRRRGFFKAVPSAVLPNPGPSVQSVERVPSDPIRLLFVGRLSPDKGAGLLADLIGYLAIPFELTLIGSGPLRFAFEHDKRIKLLDFMPRDRVRQQMIEADVLLVPSMIEENQPTVILEAASVGLPVVASDKGGIKETLRSRGYICSTKDLQAWIRAIDALRDPKTYQQQTEAMLELAEEHDASVYGQRLLPLLTKEG